MRKFLLLFLIFTMAVGLASCGSRGKSNVHEDTPQLVLDSWSPDVKNAINEFMVEYGKASKKYEEKSYAVFDFDNTCTIFDAQEQTAIYQLERMAFSRDMTGEKLEEVLSTGLSDLVAKRGTDHSEKDASYQGWIEDIVDAYEELYSKYGPFDPAGVSDMAMEEIQKNEAWEEFSVKMRAMYDLVFENEEENAAYPWITYWYTGMTPAEVYGLATKAMTEYGEEESSIERWTSPKHYKSKAGIVSYKWTKGISVPDNMIELMTALRNNGIRVYIVASSDMEVVKAAIDHFGLHDCVDGVVAMTNKVEKGSFLNEYDENGVPELPDKDTWRKGKIAVKVQPHGKGKADAIENVLVKAFGKGPLAGFMDSTEDYCFCTEFNSLKLVCCVNRGNRSVTDGGGVISELAMYQKEELGYDLKAAEKNKDILYLLQGRDENELRSFRSDNRTILVDSEEEVLFKNYPEGEEDLSQLEYDYMIRNKMTTEEVVDTFAIKMKKRDPANTLGFTYGFIEKEDFRGYQSRK